MDLTRILRKDNLVYSGKSKDVYRIPDGPYAEKYAFVFTDRATGYIDEKGNTVFDPGYDTVVGDIPGKGAIAFRFAAYFFELLKKSGIPTHYIATAGETAMIVEPADPVGLPAGGPEFEGSAPLQNLEWTWRNNAMGSFWRRYPFVRPGPAHHRRQVRAGRLKHGDGKVVLIDEISPDVQRLRPRRRGELHGLPGMHSDDVQGRPADDQGPQAADRCRARKGRSGLGSPHKNPQETPSRPAPVRSDLAIPEPSRRPRRRVLQWSPRPVAGDPPMFTPLFVTQPFAS